MSALVKCCQVWRESELQAHMDEVRIRSFRDAVSHCHRPNGGSIVQVWRMFEMHLKSDYPEDASKAAECLRQCLRELSATPAMGGTRLLESLAMDGDQWTSWMTELQELAASPTPLPASVVKRAETAVGNACRSLAAIAGTNPVL